jgi:hypothetical protein
MNIPSFFILDSQLFKEIKEATETHGNDADLGRIVRSIVNRKEKQYNHLERDSSNGCCPECGEGYENEEDWAELDSCALCGHPKTKG